MRTCEYCESPIWNKNKVFCCKNCMIEEMNLKPCMWCEKRIIKRDDKRYFCCSDCEEKSCKSRFKSNLEMILGLSCFGRSRCGEELISMEYITKNESGEISHHKIDMSDY